MTLKEKHNFIRLVVKHIYNDISKDALEYFVDGLYEKDLKKNKYFIDTQKTHKNRRCWQAAQYQVLGVL